MRLNFLRIAVRQAIRHKEQTIINILGLTVGISVFLLIFFIVRFETSFDNFHPQRDHIYRVVSIFHTQQGIDYESGVPFPTAQALRHDYPQLKNVASIVSLGGDGLITVGDDRAAGHSAKKFKEETGILFAEPQFFNMFSFHWLAGDRRTALTDPNTVLLTRTLAEKYFGAWTSAVGRYLKLNKTMTLKVTGILDDVPANTDFRLKAVISYATLPQTGANGALNSWVSVFAQHYCFITLPDNLSEETFNKRLTDVVNRYKPVEARNQGLMLLPLKDMHFDTHFNTFNNHPFSLELIHTLSLIGILVLIIACVNFINLSTARAVYRSREVGVRKALGGTRLQLQSQFMMETGALVLLATVASVAICGQALVFFDRLLGMTLDWSFVFDPTVDWLLFATATATTFLAGFYPSLVLSGFDPVTALKSKAAPRGTGSNLLRRVLVVLQFTVAQALIICMLITVGQVAYFRSAPLGFDKDAILITGLPDNKKVDFLRQQFMQQPGVEKVSFSYASPLDLNSDWNSDVIYNGVQQHDFGVNLKWADSVYPRLYHFQLLAGDLTPGPFTMVVNESFLRKLGIRRPEEALGAKVIVNGVGDTSTISGVVKDFNIAPLNDTIRPMLMEQWRQNYYTVNIKLTPSLIGKALPAIEKVWKSAFPDDVYEYRFLDENIAKYYQQEDQLSTLFKIFAGLAVFISCLGLYSLVSFMAATRAKEVGIRKTLGATVTNIVYLFSREFTLLMGLSFLIAAPFAGIFMHRWLQNYAYHYHPGPLLFAEAIGLCILIAWLSVGFRVLKAAIANPVKSLRSE
jgi:putative ABC transport system permease protein